MKAKAEKEIQYSARYDIYQREREGIKSILIINQNRVIRTYTTTLAWGDQPARGRGEWMSELLMNQKAEKADDGNTFSILVILCSTPYYSDIIVKT